MLTRFQCLALHHIKALKKVAEMIVDLQVMQAAFLKQAKNQEN
jgi:hypothetical protein